MAVAEGNGRPFTIVQLSDLHCGDQHFLPNLLERAIIEVNELDPDIVICSGDLTTFGFRDEYQLAKRYLDRLDCDSVVVIPGNHDSRNVGYVHFEELFGARNSVLRKGGVTVVAVDSTEPDLDHGQIGRGRYPLDRGAVRRDRPTCGSSCCHHHLLPVPGTGRERNVDLRRGRHDRVPAARGRRPRPLRPQARAVRVAAREPVRRQRGHGLLAAPARQRAALLQRDRGRRHATSTSSAATRSTGRSGSSSSPPRRARSRSTRRGSTGR